MTEEEWEACAEPRRVFDIHGRDAPAVFSDRKARLFICAACRRFWPYLDEEHGLKVVAFGRASGSFEGRRRPEPSAACCRLAIEMEENCAEDGTTPPELEALSEECNNFHFVGDDYASGYVDGWGPYDGAMMAACKVADAISDGTVRWALIQLVEAAVELGTVEFGVEPEGPQAEENAALSRLLRDILPYPFRPPVVDLSWRTGPVASLARAAYDEREAGTGHLDNARLAVLSDALEEAGCADEALLSHLRSPGPHVRGCWALDLILTDCR
jgi:hypothetical protein